MNIVFIFLVVILLILLIVNKKIIDVEYSDINSVTLVKLHIGATGYFEITNIDLVSLSNKLQIGIIDWVTANIISNLLGDVWRLPTTQELKVQIKYKLQISALKDAYWPSSKVGID